MSFALLVGSEAVKNQLIRHTNRLEAGGQRPAPKKIGRCKRKGENVRATAAYAIYNNGRGPALLVFTSNYDRNEFCKVVLDAGDYVRAITGNEARKIYGRCPAHDTSQATLTNNAGFTFHLLPLPALVA